MHWVRHLLVIIVVATIFHVLLSSYGFNPTDEGFVLSGSRRIIDGQMPHRDFISIHTPGSYFLHVPEVIMGGDYALWVSRLVVWVQFTVIGWLWVLLLGKLFYVFIAQIEKVLALIITIIFSVHSFPLMAWHTLDGIFVSSVGVFLSYRYSGLWKALGYLMLGAAPLFKQNYLLMAPLVLIVFGDWRKWYLWLVTGSPLMVYAIYLFIGGGWDEAVLQLSVLKNLYSVGVAPYQSFWDSQWSFLVGGLFFVMTLVTLYGSPVKRLKDALLVLTELALFLFGYVITVKALVLPTFWHGASFGIWIVTSMVTFFLAIRYRVGGNEDMIKQSKAGLLLIGLAWCASISLGYNSPALVTGPLVIFLVAYGLSEFRILFTGGLILKFWITSKLKRFSGVFGIMVLLSLTMLGLNSFKQTREENLFKDRPVRGLDERLGGVLRGAQFIRTNVNTYNFQLDLEEAKELAGSLGSKYSIIPDVAANWIKSEQPNVLSIDWTFIVEVTQGELLNRVIGDLKNSRESNVVIVQKCKADLLYLGCTPLGHEYALVNYVKNNFNVKGETNYFVLYQ